MNPQHFIDQNVGNGCECFGRGPVVHQQAKGLSAWHVHPKAILLWNALRQTAARHWYHWYHWYPCCKSGGQNSDMLRWKPHWANSCTSCAQQTYELWTDLDLPPSYARHCSVGLCATVCHKDSFPMQVSLPENNSWFCSDSFWLWRKAVTISVFLRIGRQVPFVNVCIYI